VPTRSKHIAGGAAVAAVAFASSALTGGCAGGSNERAGSTSIGARTATAAESRAREGYAWSIATTMRRVGRASVTVRGHHTKIDRATLVCWGVGAAEQRGDAQAWRRFDCIAPTIRSGRAGPDLLFTVEPRGHSTYRIEHPRFTSYVGG
jgi:hypothetical protein